MNAPLLSILVPIYRTETEALRLVEAWRRVHSSAIELILLLDGKSEGRSLFDDHESKGHLRLLQHDENQGLAQARMSLSQAARGKYLWHHDADDLPNLQHIDRVLGILAHSDEDILEFNAEMQRGATSKPLYATIKSQFLRAQSELTLTTIQHQYIAQNIWNKLIRRGFWNEATSRINEQVDLKFTLGEDLFFCYLLVRNPCKYKFYNLEIYHYLTNDTSSTRNFSSDRIQHNFNELTLAFDNIEKLIYLDEISRARLNFQKAANLYYSCIRGRVNIEASLKFEHCPELPSTVRTALHEAIIDLSGTFRVTRERLIRRKPHLGWLYRSH